MGSAPFFRGISVDLNFTLALALISVVMIQVIGFRAQGVGYLEQVLQHPPDVQSAVLRRDGLFGRFA